MIIATGRTFNYRHIMRDYGGTFNRALERWEFERLRASEIDELRSLIGVLITDVTPTIAEPPRNPIVIGDDQTYYNHFADQNPIAFFGFSSLAAFLDHLESLPRPDNTGGTCDVGWLGSREETGTANFAEAVRLARNGWSDGIGITDMLDAPPPRAKRRAHSIAGGTVNVGRMLARNPAHMIRRQKAPKHRNITIFIETVMWQGITIANAVMRAIVIGAMVDRLENDGYRCELVSVCCSMRKDWEETYQTAIRLKDARERLNLLDLTFAFGHPSFGRRLITGLDGSYPQTMQTHDNTGFISEAFNDDHRPGPNEFYIPQMTGQDQAIFASGNMMRMLEFIEPDGLPIRLKGR